MMMLMMLVLAAGWRRYLYCRHCSWRRIVDWLKRKRDDDDIVVIWRRSRLVGPSAVDDGGGGDNASSLVAII